MSFKKHPISILMPVRNGEQYLDGSISIIEKNLEPEDEIIVVDDGSSDGTNKMLLEWKKSQDNLTIIKTSGEGLVSALNLGISEASHEWVARFDVDDRYEPGRLKSQRKLFNEDVAAIFCDYTFNGSKNSNLGWIPCAVTPEATAISLISSQRTPHPGVIFNKSAVQDAGMYVSGDYPAEDLSLWLRLSKLGTLIGCPEKLLHYNLNPDSVSSQHRELALRTKARLLKENPIDVKTITRLFENWEDSIQFYDTLDFGTRRKALLLRDLLICRQRNLLSRIQEKQLKRIGLSVFSDLRTYGEIRRLFTESKNRANSREIKQSKSFQP